jgi:SAM-dependent methyltransferase
MHPGNRTWLALLKGAMPSYFDGAAVLEIGSYIINGSAREHFGKAKSYVGVDRNAGPGVDLVMEAKDTAFESEGQFDTLVYLSVFEHDPDWKAGFAHNLKWVRPGGLVIVGWGAEGNRRHNPEPWAPVPAQEVITAIASWPLRILDSLMEEDRFGPDTAGAYDLVAVKI